jgi:diaminopimelate epimerase
MSSALPFRKMNGLGNDFIVVDARGNAFPLSEGLVRAASDRAQGIGCDQFIVLEPSHSADVRMRILNADGSEVGACGNATRCVAAILGMSSPRIETAAGILDADVARDGTVTVDMGEPKFEWDRIPLATEQADTRMVQFVFNLPDGRILQDPSAVNVGNPHAVFWVSEIDSYPLAEFGGDIEHHALFPERVNVSLAEVFPAEMNGGARHDRIALRVWERGVGITRACGTAACAAAVAAHRMGKTGRTVQVDLPGGPLHIEWRAADGHVLMRGPAAHDYDGVMQVDDDGRFLSASRVPG